jgi:prepilin-type processing-associated H-X9-DG protein
MNGPFQFGTGFSFADFTDGLSNTMLVGEKQVAQDKHGVGWWDCSTYNGNYYKCSARAAGKHNPLTVDPRDTGWKFGSRHMQVVQFCFADGHVQTLSVTIDPEKLEWLSGRNDGHVVTDF